MTRTLVSRNSNRSNAGAATLCRRWGRRDRSSRFAPILESLEDMTLLSSIHWNNISGGDWATATNWVGGQLPGPGDDVVIDDLPSTPLIAFSSETTTIASLTCNEALQVSGGSLTITGNLTFASDRSLVVTGPGSSFTAAGSVSFDQVNVHVSGGGSIALPGATSYMNFGGFATFVVSGSGSALDLSGLTNLDGGHGSACSQCTPFNLTVQADSGGTVDLSNLPAAGGLVHFIAKDAGSTVELASILTVDGGSIEVDGVGAIHAPALTSLKDATLSAYEGGLLDLHTVTEYNAPSSVQNWIASGAGSKIDLSGLTSLDAGHGSPCSQCGVYETVIHPSSGGLIDLSNLTAATGLVSFIAKDTGSTIDLATLGAVDGAAFEVHDLGLINAPVLHSMANTSLSAYDGGLLDLHTVATYNAPKSVQHWVAAGAGSTIDLSGLILMDAGDGIPCSQCGVYETIIQPVSGGTVDLSGLQVLKHQARIQLSDAASHVYLTSLAATDFGPTLEADGAASLSVPALTSASATNFIASGGGQLILASSTPASLTNSVVQATAGGVVNLAGTTTMTDTRVAATGAGSLVDLSALTTAVGGHFEVHDAAHIDLSSLADMTATDLQSYAGAVLSLPAAASYVGAAFYLPAILADGTGSRVDLGTLPALTGGTSHDRYNTFSVYVQASNGGLIDLSSTATLSQQVVVQASGHDDQGNRSRVDLSALTELQGGVEAGVTLSVDGAGRIDASRLTNLASVSLFASSGATLNLPSATLIDESRGSIQPIRADGAGSQINLPSLQSIIGCVGNDRYNLYSTVIAALNGGSIDLGTTTKTLSNRFDVNAETGTLTAGTLDLQPAAEMAAFGTINGNIINRGSFLPGRGVVAEVAITGDYTQCQTGSMVVEIGGLAAGSQSDLLSVSGQANVCGTISASRIGSYAPTLGDQIELLAYGSTGIAVAGSHAYNLPAGMTFGTSFGLGAMSLVVVDDQAPSIGSLAASPDPINRGATLSLLASNVVDSNGTIARVDFYLDANGDGAFDPCCGDQLLGTDTDGADGWGLATSTASFPVGVDRVFAQARDNDSLASNVVTTTVEIQVSSNLGPVVSVGPDASIDEGSAIARSGSFTDPDDDTWTATVDYGDDSGSQPLVLTATAFDLAHTFTDDGSYTVTVAVTDEHGGSGSASFQVLARNVAPTPSINGPAGAFWGQSLSFTLAAADPSPVDSAAGFIYDVSWGDGTPLEEIAATAGNGTGITLAHTFTRAGTYDVEVTAADKDGGVGMAATRTVTINPSIIVLDQTADGALTVSGNASVNVATFGGGIFVDSNSTSAILASGNASVSASTIQVAGNVKASGNATLSPAPATGIALPADPLAGLESPSTLGLANKGSLSLSGNSQATIEAGIYSQIKVSGNASLTLGAGTYIIKGGGLTVSGNASLTGADVFIYNAGASYPDAGGTFGGITLSGNGAFSLSPAASGPYAGVVIFQSHQNTRAISVSGNSSSGITGVIYAPSAPFSISGNAALHASLVVDTLKLSGNGGLTQMAAGSDGTADNSGIADTLLAGDLAVYISDPGGVFTADERARIQDAINTWNVLLVAYNVTITEVSDPALASMVIDTGSTTVCGGLADGVLGCYNEQNSEITLVQAWNWYGGADPSQIGAGQYDFETTVMHELGHTLGLGHSADSSSPMYATLAAGVANRTVTTQDLNIDDTPGEADPQIAAGFQFVPAAIHFSPNRFPAAFGLTPEFGPAAMLPTPTSGVGIGHASTFVGRQPNVPTQPDSSIVPAPVDDQTGRECALVFQGADRQGDGGLIPAKSRASVAVDSIMDGLTADQVLVSVQTKSTAVRIQRIPLAEAIDAQVRHGGTPWKDHVLTPAAATSAPWRATRAAAPEVRLSELLLAAGFCGFGTSLWIAGHREARTRGRQVPRILRAAGLPRGST